MEEHFLAIRMPLARVLSMALVLVTLIVIGSNVRAQQDASDKSAKEQTKETKEAVKEAEKAIKDGNIDQLKAILKANPGLVSSSVKQGVLGAVADTVLLTPVVGATAPLLVSEAGSGVKLLHTAAHYGQKEAVEILIANNASVYAPDGFGFTPLHEAAMNGYPEVAKVLLAHGADLHARAKNGDTPLKTALWSRAHGARAGGRSRDQLRADFDEVVNLLR